MTALVLPRIAQRGMFLDGITYAVIARNMSLGQGSVWRPYFSESVYPVFFEQPPLGLALQSLAFRLFGDHLFVERVFSVIVFGLTGLLIMAIWRRLMPARFDSLPLFFWALPSVVTWGVINNMLENTQALFTTLAVYCIVRGSARGATRWPVWMVAAALAVLAACLTKGPVGLFPLAVPVLLMLMEPDQRPSSKRVLAMTAVIAVAFALGIVGLLVFDGPREALAGFAGTHLMPALEGERGLPRRGVDISRHLTLGIWARMVALAGVVWLARRRGVPTARVPRAALFFFAAGVSASIPICISPVLAGHYFIPSIPLFALAAAAVAFPAAQTFQRARGAGQWMPAALAVLLVIAAVGVLLFRGPMERRDMRLLAGLDAISPELERGTTIGTCASLAREWGLHSYVQRLFRVSLDPSDAPRSQHFLVAHDSCAPPAGCQQTAGDGTVRLYACRPAESVKRVP